MTRQFNAPFKKLKERMPAVSIAEELYGTKCIEVAKYGIKSEIAIGMWASTKGNPCTKCNRPTDCLVRIYSKP